MEGDINLLFAILAVQLKGVTPSQILEAGAAWSGESAPSLSQRLLDAGVLGEGERTLLDHLVAEAIRIHGGDVFQTLQTLGGRERVEEVLRGGDSASQLDGMSTVPMSQVSFLDESGDLAYAVEEAPGRYSQVSQYGRGGMGRVLLVHDEQIGRNIALKELMPQSQSSGASPALSPVHRTAALSARFLQEARITGQLEHPSIVPVYEVGRRLDGTLYYTMKLVKGRTLSWAIRECAGYEERLRLLPRFVDLCHAAAYAHSKGVIHRDIKPSNVMVGEFGETVVLDWGLAKRQGLRDIHREAMQQAWQDLDSEDFQGPAQPDTTYGKALGTPNYMPPEQAEGRLDDIDERSDVYSLGAVLYQLITGCLPFAGGTVSEIVTRVVSEPLKPVLSLEPQSAPELAGICEKAMQKEPGARYQSAKELAQEVERFLSGALVQAYSYSLAQHFKRYYRRHRAVLNTVLLAAVALVVLAVYSYVRVSQARDREHRQRLAAEQAQQIAVGARAHEEEARQRAEHLAYVSQIRLAQAHMLSGNYTMAKETLWKTAESRRHWEWGCLLGQCNLDRLTVQAHTAGLIDAVFSPDGRRIASLCGAEPIKVWDAGSGQPVASMAGRSGRLRDLAFSPDGSRIAGGSWDKTARIWEAETGKELALLQGHRRSVCLVRFDDSGQRVLTASEDGTARIWDAATGQVRTVFGGGAAALCNALFSPNGTRVLTESVDGLVQVWDASNAHALYAVSGGLACFGSGGGLLATAAGAGATVWSGETGERLFDLTGHLDTIRDLAFCPDAKSLITVSRDGTAKQWSAETGQEMASYDHGEPLESLDVAPGGRFLATRSVRSVMLWDLDTGDKGPALEGHSDVLTEARFAPDGRCMVTASLDKTFKVWDVEALFARACIGRQGQSLSALAVSAASGQLATASWDKTVRLMDAASGRLQAVYACYAMFGSKAVAFSRDGRRAAVVQDRFAPFVWDLESNRLLSVFFGHRGGVECVALSPDASRAVSGSWDNTARVWDTQSGAELLVLQGHVKSVTGVAYSPDGRRIVTASSDMTAKVWDADSGEERITFSGHSRGVNSATFSPDGRLVLTASSDGTALLWEVETGQGVIRFEGHGGSLPSASFHPDGTRIVTTSMNGTAKVWDAQTGEVLVTLRGHTSFLLDAAFGPDGQSIFTASHDGAARRWNAEPWRVGDLPGDLSLSWQERYALYRQQRDSGIAASAAPLEPVPCVVVTTEAVLRECLGRFCTALEAEPTPGVGLPAAGDGVILTSGPRRDALARLTFAEGDRLLRIGTRALDTGRGAAAAVRDALMGLDQAESLLAPIEMMRGEQPMQVLFHVVPGQQLRRETTLPRKQALALLRWEQRSFAENEDSLRQVGRTRARDRGEAIPEPGGLAGLWVLGGESPAERQFLSALGAAPNDHLVRVNGAAITDLRVLIDQYEEIAHILESGAPFTLTLDIERGEFQQIACAIHIE